MFLGCAEDGLLEEEEMSQLSGRTLDLRNSAALLKLARMSVDATALQDSAHLAAVQSGSGPCAGTTLMWHTGCTNSEGSCVECEHVPATASSSQEAGMNAFHALQRRESFSAPMLHLVAEHVMTGPMHAGGIRAHRPQQMELAQSAQSGDETREPDLAGAPPPIQAESPRLGAGRPPRARGPSSQHALSRSGLNLPLQVSFPDAPDMSSASSDLQAVKYRFAENIQAADELSYSAGGPGWAARQCGTAKTGAEDAGQHQ